MLCHAMGCHAMRCIAVGCCGVRSDGGLGAGVQAYYAATPLCRHLRDLDLIALQMGLLHVPPESFLALLLNKMHIEK